MTNVIAAVVQMSSRAQVSQNLYLAAGLILGAVKQGAELVVLPEYFYCMSEQDVDRLVVAEPFLTGRIQKFCAQQARRHRIWLVAGTVPIISENAGHFYNASLVFNPEGHCVTRYNKIHLFDFETQSERYCESDFQEAGTSIETAILPWGNLRTSICYDLRFPELFRWGDSIPDMISLPAAFTYTTGLAHWQPLITARAIENQAFVLASAQVGIHENQSRTYGHSMIVDPWGKVLACAEDQENCVVTATLDFDELQKVRTQLPVHKHRRFF